MKVHKIHNKVFDFYVYWIDGTPEEAEKWLESKWVNHDRCLKNIQWISMYWKFNIIYMGDRSDYVLLHECIHTIQHILEKEIWIPTWYSNTEVLAYNVDWLYRSIMYRYLKARWNDKYKCYRV